MTDRGWSADPSVVLRHRVVMWLAERQREEPRRIKSAADVAAGLGAHVRDVVAAVDLLAAAGLFDPRDAMVAEKSSARLTLTGLSQASQWASARASRRERRAACRDAVLAWLYEQRSQVRDALPFLTDERAYFFGDRLTEEEANEALDYLERVGLVEGVKVAECVLLNPKVTADGQSCVERYESNVGAWLDRSSAAPTFAISNSRGVNIAANSPGARQTVTITTDARQQMLKTTDALIATLPVLGLTANDEDRAREVAERLREAAEREQDEPGRVRALLRDVHAIAISGTGSAAGAGIVALAEQIAHSLGL